MKIVFATQRVDMIPGRDERRDALDQRWAEFLISIGCVTVPVPNNMDAAKALLASVMPDGILLSGGNSPAEYDGDAPKRDDTDILMLDHAVRNNTPLFGVCRGMQSAIIYFGGTLRHVPGHVATRHDISGAVSRNVNSYHSLAVDKLPNCFDVLAEAGDGVIEAVRHKNLPILAIMWHPEREQPFDGSDLQLIQKFLEGADAE